MNGAFRRIRLLTALAVFAGTAQASVTVTFPQPQRYTDTGWQLHDERDVTEELARHLRQLGSRHLATGQSLSIEVLDIDLAGEVRFRPRDASQIRILRGGVDFPRLRMRYVMEVAGRPGEAREETVSDMNYLMRTTRGGEWLAHEKRMLDDWFRKRFAPTRD